MQEGNRKSKAVPFLFSASRNKMITKKNLLVMKKRLRRSKRLAKNALRFHQEEKCKQQYGEKAMRVLFSSTIMDDLPDEMLLSILSYLNAKELMNARCISKRFLHLVDNVWLWSDVSFQNLWPITSADHELFRRGVEASNAECLVKLGLNHLYHYNLAAFSKKSERDVKVNASCAANYFRQLDNTIAPRKPITWMLIRPPWSIERRNNLKRALYKQVLEKAEKESADSAILYSVGKIMTIGDDDREDLVVRNGIDYFKQASSRNGCSHSQLEALILSKNTLSDKGSKLQWFRQLFECSSKNQDGTFELCKFLMLNEKENFMNTQTAQGLCCSLFKQCNPSGIEKLEQLQPKVNEAMRCILLDWLAEITYMKRMPQKVLHLTISFIDRYLRSRFIERTKLQLLGITCLVIAAKSFEGSSKAHLFTVREAAYLTDGTFDYGDVIMMMGEVIGTLKGNIWCPMSFSYFEFLLEFPEMRGSVRDMCEYILDISLQFICFGSVKPSVIACAVVYLANIMTKKADPWSTRFIDYTGIAIKDIVNIAAMIYHRGFICPPVRDDRGFLLESIKTRYMADDVTNVASTPIPSETEMKNLFMASDENLVCTSTEPLYFTVVSALDDTLNISTTSIDYYGDCEDDNVNSSFDDDDESFYVGRHRGTSFQSVVEDYSDDETMDGEGVSFGHAFRLADQRQDNFTPIFQVSKGTSNMELRNNNNGNTSFQFDFTEKTADKNSDNNFAIDKIFQGNELDYHDIPTSSKTSERRSKRKCVLVNRKDYHSKRNKISD